MRDETQSDGLLDADQQAHRLSPVGYALLNVGMLWSQCKLQTLAFFNRPGKSKVKGVAISFSAEWYKTYQWLVLSSTTVKEFCAYCRSSKEKGLLTEKVAGGGDALITVLFNNLNKAWEGYVQHKNTPIHKKAVFKKELMKQPSVVAQN